MITVETSIGLEVKIDETVCDDMLFLEALASSSENALYFTKAVTMLLGKEQKEKIYEALKDKNGRVPVARFNGVFEEIMTKAGESVKNS